MDYEDYREVGSGVKFPFLFRKDPVGPRTELGSTVTMRVEKVQDNVPPDSGKFVKPESSQQALRHARGGEQR